tara:strand:- start:68267 stop:68752 length:486 start_codon:yes stop_codon:yes gene_type:complete
MNAIDLTPLYRSSVGFDHLDSLLTSALNAETSNSANYPAYNIEVIDENRYAISLAIAGFTQDELEIQVEKSVLTIRGTKTEEKKEREYLYQGISNRSFERKFNLADYIEVTGADFVNGLLTINLVKDIPEVLKPKTIAINKTGPALHNKTNALSNDSNKVA